MNLYILWDVLKVPIHRGIENDADVFKSEVKRRHFSAGSSGNASFQWRLVFQSPCRKILAGTTMGASQPRGSNSLAITDKTDRLLIVEGEATLSRKLKMNLSDAGFHLSPRARSVSLSSKAFSTGRRRFDSMALRMRSSLAIHFF